MPSRAAFGNGAILAAANAVATAAADAPLLFLHAGPRLELRLPLSTCVLFINVQPVSFVQLLPAATAAGAHFVFGEIQVFGWYGMLLRQMSQPILPPYEDILLDQHS